MKYLKILGKYPDGRVIYWVNQVTPAFGYIAFGVIDRGTNVLQVRPTTICPLNCIFCSVDAGPFSKHRWAEYIVDKHVIIKGVKEAIRYKGSGIEVLIDTMGDPLTYTYLIELIHELKRIPGVSSIALETHGALMSYKYVDKLEKAGLDRINLSIETLDRCKARILQGVYWFDVKTVINVSEYIAKNTKIDLHVTPLWIPGVNDKDVIDIVRWAIKIGAGKRWPPVTIQKYNVHRFGRKVRGVRPLSWREYWSRIEDLERKLGIKLKWSMDEWGMKYMKRIPIVYDIGSLIEVNIVGRGIFRGEYIGIDDRRHRIITIIGKRVQGSKRALIEIIKNKNGIYLGKIVKNL